VILECFHYRNIHITYYSFSRTVHVLRFSWLDLIHNSTFAVEQHQMLSVFHHTEDGNCKVCKNVETPSTLDTVFSRKPELHISQSVFRDTSCCHEWQSAVPRIRFFIDGETESGSFSHMFIFLKPHYNLIFYLRVWWSEMAAPAASRLCF
jgi:hypothetical protein